MQYPAAYAESTRNIVNVSIQIILCCFFMPISSFEGLANPDENASAAEEFQAHL